MTKIAVRLLDAAELPRLAGVLAQIEAEIEYPLGNDWFRIDHGADYFAFFRRLGRLRFFVAEAGPRVIGMMAVVERDLPRLGVVHYVCDLKTVPGQTGTSRPLLRALEQLPGRAGYGISMNPSAGDNRLIKLARRWLPGVEVGAVLNIYSLSAPQLRSFAAAYQECVGGMHLLSLAGVKDIVLRSTGRAMPLLHLQPDRPGSADRSTPDEAATHMFCAVVGSGLDQAARTSGLSPTAAATILHVGMADAEWSFVLTSDI